VRCGSGWDWKGRFARVYVVVWATSIAPGGAERRDMSPSDREVGGSEAPATSRAAEPPGDESGLPGLSFPHRLALNSFHISNNSLWNSRR